MVAELAQWLDSDRPGDDSLEHSLDYPAYLFFNILPESKKCLKEPVQSATEQPVAPALITYASMDSQMAGMATTRLMTLLNAGTAAHSI